MLVLMDLIFSNFGYMIFLFNLQYFHNWTDNLHSSLLCFETNFLMPMMVSTFMKFGVNPYYTLMTSLLLVTKLST